MARAWKRPNRWRFTGAAVLLVSGLLAGCGGGTARPQHPPENTTQPGAQVTLRFRARAAGKAAGSGKLAFFGEYRRVPRQGADPPASVPPPGPGTGYVSVRLTEGENDGAYTASQYLDPGRYAVAIFAGHGVRNSGAGSYPAAPVTLLPHTASTVELTGDRTVRGVYHRPAPSSSSATPTPSTTPTSAPTTTSDHRHG
jgi:hypothetical protein